MEDLTRRFNKSLTLEETKLSSDALCDIYMCYLKVMGKGHVSAEVVAENIGNVLQLTNSYPGSEGVNLYLDRSNFGIERPRGAGFYMSVVLLPELESSDYKTLQEITDEVELPEEIKGRVSMTHYDKTEQNFAKAKDELLEILSCINCIETSEVYQWTLYIYCDLWFCALMNNFHGKYFWDMLGLKSTIITVPYSHFADSVLYNYLRKSSKESIDRCLRILSLERQIEGQMIQRESIERSIRKLGPDQNNVLQERTNKMKAINSVILWNKNEIERLRRVEDRVAAKPGESDRLRKIEERIYARPCMDIEQQNETENIEDKSENTAIGAGTIPDSSELMEEPPKMEFVSEVFPDIKHTYKDLTSRWIDIATIPLTTTITLGTVIYQQELPADFVIDKWNRPNMLPFRVHEFFTGGMHLKFQWNIPKTNQFAIQIGFYYHWLQRDRPLEVINPWTISQMPGGSLNGHAKNSTEIHIPYFSYNPTIPIRENQFMKNLYYGSVFAIAMTDYEVADGACDTSTLKVYAKFDDDLQFFGQREAVDTPPNFVPFEPQRRITKGITKAKPCMMAAAGAVAAKTLAGENGIVTRLAESAISGVVSSANAVVQKALHTSTGVCISAIENMNNKALKAIKGNLDKPTNTDNQALHIRTTTNIASGTGHYSGDKVRLIESGETTHPIQMTGVEKYGNLSDIIHTLGFVNSFSINTSNQVGDTLCTMLVQPGIVDQFDGNVSRFVDRSIYNWTPVDHLAGWFMNYQMKLHYRLVPVFDAFKTVRIRVAFMPNVLDFSYEQSGSTYYETFDYSADFNAQTTFDFYTPYITSMMNFNHRTPEGVAPVAGVVKVFLETAMCIPGNLVPRGDVLVYKRAKPGDAIFSVPRDNQSLLVYNPQDVPVFPPPLDPPPPPPPEWTSTEAAITPTNLQVAIGSWVVTVNFRVRNLETNITVSSNTPNDVVLEAARFRNTFNHSENTVSFLPWMFSGTWSPSVLRLNLFGNQRMTWNATEMSSGVTRFVPFDYQGDLSIVDAILAKGAMDQRDAVTETTDLTPPMSAVNQMMHGESHMGLLDNLRRFQYFDSFSVWAPTASTPTNVASLPLNFGGALFRNDLNAEQRQDKIIHLHDAMRYTRGSIRFMFIVETQLPGEGTFIITHIPQVVDYPFTDEERTQISVVETTGFGQSLMSLRQNNVHTVEFPMYIPGQMVLNASYLSSELQVNLCQGLGVCEMHYMGRGQLLNITVLRAFADDTAMYCFNGFPIREEIPPARVLPFYSDDNRKKALLDCGDIEANPGPIQSRPCMNHNVSISDDSMAKLAEVLKQVNISVGFRNSETDGGSGSSIIVSILTQIGHAVNNPTKVTFVLSTIEILNAFGLFSTQCLDKMKDMVMGLWELLTKKRENVVEAHAAVDGGFTSADDEILLISKFAGFLLSSIASFFSVKGTTIPQKMSSSFLTACSLQARVVEFFKTLLQYIKDITIYVCEKFFPESTLLKHLKKNEYVDWIRTSAILTDGSLMSKIRNSPKCTSLVYLMVKKGEELQLKLATLDRRTNLSNAFNAEMAKLKKLRDTLGRNLNTPPVIFKPFSVWIHGTAKQIGKSHALNDIITAIQKAVSEEEFSDLKKSGVYTVPSGDPYWEKYDHEQVIKFDDFHCIQSVQNTYDSDMAKFGGLIGIVPYTIPTAECESKGKISSAKLVVVASNFGYPKINGMDPGVVHSRRNCLYEFEMVQNENKLKCCKIHSNHMFSCHDCRALNSEAVYESRSYLKITRQDPMIPRSEKNEVVSYRQMIEEIVTLALKYYKMEMVDYKKRLEEFSQKHQVEERTSMVPTDCLDDIQRLIEDPAVAEVIGQPKLRLHPAGMTDKLKKWYPEEKSEDLCRHLNIKACEKVEFDNDGIPMWPNRDGLRGISCGSSCMWDSVKDLYFRELDYFCKDKGLYPMNYPIAHSSEYAELIQEINSEAIGTIKERKWYQRKKWILGVIGASLAALVVWRVGKWVLSPKEKEVECKVEKPKVGNTKAHAALMASGDVKTKFKSKWDTKKHVMRKFERVDATPAGDNALEEFLDKYEHSILQVATWDDAYKMRALHCGNGIYISQVHALCSILVKTSNEMLKDYESRKYCDPTLCLGEQHSIKCTEKVNRDYKLTLQKLTKSGKIEEVKLSIYDFYEYNNFSFGIDAQGTDVCMFRVDPGLFGLRSIKENFVTDSSLDYATAGQLAVYDPGNITNMERTKMYNVKEAQYLQTLVKYDDQVWIENGVSQFLLYGYAVPNPDPNRFNSACGSILFDKCSLKILGILSACNDNYLYFNAIEETYIDKYSDSVKTREINAASVIEPIQAKGTMYGLAGEKITVAETDLDMGSGQRILITEPRKTIYHSTKTSIHKSVCHEKFGKVKRAPAIIAENEDKGWGSLVRGLQNYIKHEEFPESDIAEAVRDVSIMFTREAKPAIPVVSKRDYEEAICGINGHIARICMSTSPGFPWCTYKTTKKKSDLITFNEDHSLLALHPDLSRMIERNDALMRKGEVPLTIYQVSHKDERLALEKLRNVRLIQGSPLDLTISARQYLMDFNYAFQLNRSKLEHRVGMNVASLEWDEMTRSLIEFSPHICVGDYSKYGPRLLTKLVDAAYGIMNDWYEYHGQGHDNHVRTVLAERAKNSLNIAYGYVFEMECGSPSGALNTVIVNSICNMIYIRCAWIGIMKEKEWTLSTLHAFKKYVKFICYGDDVIFAVKEEVLELFNNQTISDYFARYNLKYTDVTKGNEMRKYCSISDSTFLKCGFQLYTDTKVKPGIWICVPDYDDIKDTTNWVRMPKGLRGQFEHTNMLVAAASSNCEDAIRKMWFHGKQKFESFQDEIQKFWVENNLDHRPNYFHFDSLKREYGIVDGVEHDISQLKRVLVDAAITLGQRRVFHKGERLESLCEDEKDADVELPGVEPPVPHIL